MLCSENYGAAMPRPPYKNLFCTYVVVRTAGSSFIWNYADPLTSLELINLTLMLSRSVGGGLWGCRGTSSAWGRYQQGRVTLPRGIYFAKYCGGGGGEENDQQGK